MSNEQFLKRKLTSVGRRVFVEYYGEFIDETLSNQDVADRLPYSYTLKSRLSRTSHARSIIRQGLSHTALEMISLSPRIDTKTQGAAQRLLESL